MVDPGRQERVLKAFNETYGYEAGALFSAPGRTEIGGNHTDHQHGRVLAGAVSLDILAAASLNVSGIARVYSEGFGETLIDLSDLTPHTEEINTTAALIRGVAGGCAAKAPLPEGTGIDIYCHSLVPGGSGLSSSAAFEVLIGTVFNELFYGARFDAVEIARIGQYAENIYFGKPSGLMDQTACSVGGVISIDFKDPSHPLIEKIDLDLSSYGYALCILECGADHADLTAQYAAITDELFSVSRHFGKSVLRDVPEEDFMRDIALIRAEAGDRALLRALHIYADNKRVAKEVEALKKGDFESFLALVRESGHSSVECLQNVIPEDPLGPQDLMFTIAYAERLLDGAGAVRVQGGGFAGTAEAFVPLSMLSEFSAGMERVLGKGRVHTLSLRSRGGTRIF